MLLFQDEKGPIAAKTYGGSSWSSVQAKVEHDQKVKGLLNVLLCDPSSKQVIKYEKYPFNRAIIG